jgi:hypothetical protein
MTDFRGFEGNWSQLVTSGHGYDQKKMSCSSGFGAIWSSGHL